MGPQFYSRQTHSSHHKSGNSHTQDNCYQGVKVVTKDGKVFTYFNTFRKLIGPETTMAMDFIRKKFHECTEFSGLYSAEESNDIIDRIMELEKDDNITPLIEMLSVDIGE